VNDLDFENKAELHKHFSTHCFNETWKLIDKKIVLMKKMKKWYTTPWRHYFIGPSGRIARTAKKASAAGKYPVVMP
jgi:hypothetical protein